MPKFYMLVGLPGSGKSTYSKTIKDAVIISSDALRKELYGSEEELGNPFEEMIKRTIAALKNEKDVVFDATNLSTKKRRYIVERIKKYADYKKAIVIATPYTECLKRNAERERHVPEEVIKRMYMAFTMPCKQEGFDEVSIHYTDFVPMNESEMCKIPHDNSHHHLSIGDHMIAAYTYLRDNYPQYRSDYELVTATMLHDIGKPFCKTFVNKRGETSTEAHYYGHESVGAYDVMFYDISEAHVINIALLIQNHMCFYIGNPEKVRNFLGDELYGKLLILHDCDKNAH